MMKGKKKVDPYADERKDPYAGDVTSGPGGRIMQEDIPPPAPPAPIAPLGPLPPPPPPATTRYSTDVTPGGATHAELSVNT